MKWRPINFGHLSLTPGAAYPQLYVRCAQLTALIMTIDNHSLLPFQMLTKSCSLPNARKIAAILYNRAAQSNRVREPALNIPHVTTEDLLIGIASAAGKGLVSNEIFEFMKAAASKQSDPVKALVGIAEDLFTLMNLRPTLWVKRDLGILDTETLMIKNNQFVMAAARNDYAKVQELLDLGQELTALHSEMKYTALHAAADFGAGDALKLILKTGAPRVLSNKLLIV